MAQIIRALRRKFGIAAPLVAVRPHVPWYWRWLGYVAIGAVVVGVGVTTYDYGMELAGFRQSEAAREMARLKAEVRSQEAQLAELRAQVTAAERQLQIEKATYGDLARQVKLLSEENASLREDLAFFQSLMAAGAKEGSLTVNRFRVQPEALPGEYRYRLLLVQTGQRVKEFQGRLQFVVNVEQGDQKYVLTLPREGEKGAKDFQVSFRFFQRVEGTFKLAPEAVVRSLQVRVYENGSVAPKLTQTIGVS
jgi:chromosome segregation ATPase